MAETETETKSQLAPDAPHAPAGPVDYHPGWNVLVDDFGKGGLTPAQYASFGMSQSRPLPITHYPLPSTPVPSPSLSVEDHF